MAKKPNSFPNGEDEFSKKEEKILTFEDVHSTPYVQESLACLLAANSAQFPYLAPYEDDIRQEALIFLAHALPRYNPGRADVKTYCRIVLQCGVNRARRRFRNESQRAISHAVPLDALLRSGNDDGQASYSMREQLAKHAQPPCEDCERTEEFQCRLDSLSELDRKICEMLLDGRSIGELFHSVCTKHYFYNRAIPNLKKVFHDKRRRFS